MRRGWLVACVLLMSLAVYRAGPAWAVDEHSPSGGQGAPAKSESAGHGGHSEGSDDVFGKALDLGIWTVVVFLVLLFVLSKFAWKPMLEALQKREQNIHSAIEEAHRARNEAQRMREQLQQQLDQAHEQVRDI